MAPRVCWLRPEDHLCSMSLAKVKKLTTPMKAKGKASSGKSSKLPSSSFTGYSLAKKRKMFTVMKQGNSESVTKWHDKIKELASLCKFGDDLEDKMKDKFIKASLSHFLSESRIIGLKAGPIHDGVQEFTGSMDELLEAAKNLESNYNKQAFGSDFQPSSSEDSGNSEADVDFEKDKKNYREVHAYDCPCIYCDIIRCNKSRKCYDPNNSHPKKLILVSTQMAVKSNQDT
ncbi:hypothetical protein TSAR_016301 [Trichomalopsis sarcophagae]|uniref:Uncharacterized protein n=1 Tax=Trichomalopsis sarcophagae TaxID=543379 RepID=A0A232EMT8_9HYME|nr:hypothetical protein TSAR_016301 [Trichomalopsis sarcophagae]